MAGLELVEGVERYMKENHIHSFDEIRGII